MRTSLVLVVVLSVTRTVYGDCDRPTAGSNMILITNEQFPVRDGTTVTFDCEVGYKKVGDSGTIACSAGSWSDLRMRCEKKNCGSAGEVINGRVEYSEGTEFGAFAHVVCIEGYVVVALVNQIYCGEKGWQGRLASCEVVVCEPPNQIANGYFSPMKDDYEHSEVITYSCEGNYILDGSRTASCQDDRQFKPAPPKCVLVECSDPKVENGVMAGGARPPYKHQSSVTIKCKVGHDMFGQGTVSCDINSKWSPALPECKPTECKAPKIQNGEVVDGSRATYKFAETITVKCTEGYKLSGQNSLTCGEKSQWSAPLPECTLIQCQTPEVQGGELVGGPRPSYKYSDTVSFKCISGYELSGESTLTCDVNSQWSPKLPKCKQVACRTPVVTNGQVVEGLRPSYKYLDSVVFACNSGYSMNGQSTLTCDLNSQWSPELPQCTRNKGNGLTIGLSILGVAVVSLVGAGVYYFGFLRKKKGKLGRPVAPA